ncbi:RNA polymerase sigma factor [Paraliomyxa miuraensis]|uniref:RNA polymerase sigma factor n=1 Tax=Paraliomyxa miuraensis TaxID=376150 RepID=UPI00225C24EE|nr:sigma-70 family RNA polymerase sigma factor [Paraliomyxa miuraensis]MCX4240958.1 sigma-70 family RNA polymerase sigma factor [Paraliomyxa miuraensis]
MVSDDGELHRRWQGGDREAGRLLFSLHARGVIRFFRSKLPEVAEDLTQEVFARFFRSARTEVHVRGFLFGIARNVLSEELRRRQPDVRLSDVSIAELARPSSTRMIARQWLLDALQQLPIDDQIVLELQHWEGMSSPELAVVLGVSPSAARTRVSTARKRLRSILERRSGSDAVPADFQELESWVSAIRQALDAAR